VACSLGNGALVPSTLGTVAWEWSGDKEEPCLQHSKAHCMKGSDVFHKLTQAAAQYGPHASKIMYYRKNKQKPQSQEPVSRQISVFILVQHDHPVFLIALISWIFQYTAQSLILWIRNVPATNFGDDAACHDTMPLISVSDTRQKITVCPKKFYQIFWNNIKLFFLAGPCYYKIHVRG
jgi:hypothetical protein